jgi:hypothetical protein
MMTLLLSLGLKPRAMIEVGEDRWYVCVPRQIDGYWVWQLWIGPYRYEEVIRRRYPAFTPDNLEITDEQVEVCRTWLA